ncbi:MAG TPA: hypothetical protein VD707_05820 [Gemmatimonadales bacterium]|nr:hypothetical protein [Gemmatimonadales bacterium]
MSPVSDRGRWMAPLALLLMLAAARPAAAAPVPACLAVVPAAATTSTAQTCYKEMITYVTAAGEFFAAVDAFNDAVENGTASDVQTAGDAMDDASSAMVWAGVLLVVCLIQLV